MISGSSAQPAPPLSVSSPSAVISPEQLSMAVRLSCTGTSSRQATVVSAGGFGATGATSSTTVIVCVTLLLLPQSSVNVQVRVMISGSSAQPAPSLSASTPSMVISPEQLSMAISSIGAGTSARQATVVSAGGFGAMGASSSSTVTVKEQVSTLPLPSVAV